MAHYKLSYFNIRGVAEPIRQIFKLAEKDFEDNRVERESWPELKPTTPFGQMPVLEVDGKQLAQSNAISRYLGRQFDLAGKCPIEQAQVDSYADQFKDFVAEVRPFITVLFGFTEGDKDKLYQDVFVPAVKKHLPFFVKAIKSSGSGFLVASGVTWVDLLVAENNANFLGKFPEVYADFPEIKEYVERVHSIPQIAKWLKERPVTPM